MTTQVENAKIINLAIRGDALTSDIVSESWSLKTKQQGQPMRETRKSFKKNHERIIFFNEVEITFYGEFDPGSGRTLAACLTHASRTENFNKFT